MDFTPAARSCFLGSFPCCAELDLGYEHGQQGNIFPRFQAAQAGNESHPASQNIGAWNFPLGVKRPGPKRTRGAIPLLPTCLHGVDSESFLFYREMPLVFHIILDLTASGRSLG
jgi:hypothetical protein